MNLGVYLVAFDALLQEVVAQRIQQQGLFDAELSEASLRGRAGSNKLAPEPLSSDDVL